MRNDQHEPASSREVEVHAELVILKGTMAIPAAAKGIVLFVHGSGSNRQSQRNLFVGRFLNEAGIATLYFDLLTEHEKESDALNGKLRYDVALMAERVVGAVDWVANYEPTRQLRIGLFGAGSGGAAALIAAAERPGVVGAVVCRGGRADLARDALQKVHTPTLLLVGADDAPSMATNREALMQMHGDARLEVIPGATHMFAEPGALERVALSARDWFQKNLEVPLTAAA